MDTPPVGFHRNLIQRRVRDLDTGVPAREGDGGASVLLGQRAHFGEVEEPLGIGLRLSGEARELRQPGADDHERQVELGAAVDGGDDRRQLLPREVLDLVDHDEDPTLALAGGLSDGDEEVGEVVGQAA